MLPRRFCELSQGEQKQVLLGSAVAEAPRLLVADEPCTSLDAPSRAAALGLLEALGRGGHTNLVYTTHYPEEVIPCISHALHLRAGSAVYAGPIGGYSPAEWRGRQ